MWAKLYGTIIIINVYIPDLIRNNNNTLLTRIYNDKVILLMERFFPFFLTDLKNISFE